MVRSRFDESLEQLHIDFYQMGGLVKEAVHLSIKSFIEQDKGLAQQVKDDDININDKEVSLEKKSIELIALQSPVTSDLRKIITVMKASADLERMGDHAVRIAKATLQTGNVERSYDIESLIADMAEAVIENIETVLDAYVREDTDTAIQVGKNDKDIDKMRKNIQKEAQSRMLNNSSLIESSTDYIQVTNFLERIGDYAKNVAEWVLFIKEGNIYELNNL